MKVHVQTELDCLPERVWNEVQKSALLLVVAHPIVRIEPVDEVDFPVCWAEGATIRCRSYLFGVVPLGVRTIFLERIDQAAREIQSRENDPLVRRWDHLITVAAADGGRTLYRDMVEIEAGLLTLPVWLFASGFYRHRQMRWRRLAKRLAGA
jgi:hypothetical protein